MNANTTIISTRFDSLKRRLIKVLRLGKSDVVEPFEVSPFGIDSNPLKDMKAIYMETQQKGVNVIVGYMNKNQLADVGETRLFSTDANGSLKTYIWLHNDGTMEIGGKNNHIAQYEGLATAFNQLKSDFNDLVSKFNAHVHSGVTTGAGTSAVPTTSGSSSNADITPAKIETIKTI